MQAIVLIMIAPALALTVIIMMALALPTKSHLSLPIALTSEKRIESVNAAGKSSSNAPSLPVGEHAAAADTGDEVWESSLE